MALDLTKKLDLVKTVLAKRQVPEGLIAQVKMCLDVSGSMQSMFANGTVQALVDRLLPIGMRFDDNQSLEAYAFASSATRTSDIKPEDAGDYVQKFTREARDAGVLWGGTDYSKALELIKKEMSPSKGFFGMFKKEAPKLPSYLMFITDGDSSNESATEAILKELAELKIYVQMIGVGYGFRFLQRMADKYDHVGFVTFPNLERVTDEEMYEQLLGEEFCTWIKAQ